MSCINYVNMRVWILTIIVIHSGIIISSAKGNDKYMLYTGPDIDPDGNTLHVETLTHFRFKVRACAEARIYLRTTDSNQDNTHKVIVLGESANTLSSISDNSGGVLQKYTPDILHCNVLRAFWIQWNTTSLKVGRGPTYGVDTLLIAHFEKERNFIVRSATVSTGNSYAGTWELEDNAGHGLSVVTPSEDKFRHLWRTVENRPGFLAFSVKSCGDVWIGLRPEMGQLLYAVKLGLGKNGTNAIYHFNELVKESTHEHKACELSAIYWVSWEYDIISVGTGYFSGRNELMFYAGWEYYGSVNTLAFAASSPEGATWDFVMNDDTSYIFFTPEKQEPEKPVEFWHHLLSPAHHAVMFLVESCTEVTLVLEREPDGGYEDTIFIVIGEQGDQRTAVYDYQHNLIDFASTPDIISCDHGRQFWLCWEKGDVILGQAPTSGIHTVISVPWPEAPNLHSLGFGTSADSHAFWMLRPVKGDSMQLSTKYDLEYPDTWAPVSDHIIFMFTVTSCTEARVYLYEEAGIMQHRVFGFALGWRGDKALSAVIEREAGKETALLNQCESRSGDLLSCTEPRRYWVGWRQKNVLELGYGEDRSKVICSYRSRDVILNEVNAVALASDDLATWSISADRGDEIVMRAPDTSTRATLRWMQLVDGLEGISFRARGDEITLILSNTYRNGSDAFEVTIGDVIKIRYHDQQKQSATSGVLHPEIIRDFWITWDGVKLAVGASKMIGEKTVVFIAIDKDINTNSIGVRIPDGKSEFRVLARYGTELSFETSNGFSTNQMQRQVDPSGSVVFAVSSCGQAEVTMTPLSGDVDLTTGSYSVAIGAARNTQTWVKLNAQTQMTIDTPDIVDCVEERFFWVTWGDGEIAVGHGNKPGIHTITNWYDLDPQPVNNIQFHTGYGSQGRWRLRLNQEATFEDLDKVIDKPTESKGHTSGGAIAGIIIGLLLVLLIGGAAAYVVVRGVPPGVQSAYQDASDWLSEKLGRSASPSPQSFQNEAEFGEES